MSLQKLPVSDRYRGRAATVQRHFAELTAWAENPDPDNLKKVMQAVKFLYAHVPFPTLLPLASLLLRLNGKPYSLSGGYYPIEPMFSTYTARRMVWKTGRQVSKSTSAAARLCLRAALIPYHHILTVAPRSEQIRRFSSNYVRPFLKASPFRGLIQGEKDTDTVSQKTLKNGSNLFFSFAFLDCDRIRGYACREIVLDEIQDLDFSFLDIIRECMSASPHGPIESFFGTPKTLTNTLQNLWESSSQAEWMIPCDCGHINIPDAAHRVLDMVQPKGVTCVKCSRVVDPAQGYWEHAHPNRKLSFVGYHLPQIIMPMHYANKYKWKELITKKNNMPTAIFQNEVLGESCDIGTKMLTLTQLKKSCSLPWENTMEEALKHAREYHHLVLGVDWGGHGKDHMSTTTIAIVGLVAGNRQHCIYATRLHSSITEVEEIAKVIQLYRIFGCKFIAHDYGGSGALREIMMIHAGMSVDNIFPIQWVMASARELVDFRTPSDTSRAYYSVDKTRALGISLAMIKLNQLLMPRYSDDSVFNDWLSLIEEKTESSRRSDIYLIRRNPSTPDDCAHACCFAQVGLWHSLDAFPNLAESIPAALSIQDELRETSPTWADVQPSIGPVYDDED